MDGSGFNSEYIHNEGDTSSSSDDDTDGWDEEIDDPMGDDVYVIDVNCLFCVKSFKLIEGALKHCSTRHDFDLTFLKNKFNMDCYSYIKLINYIRTNDPDPKELMKSVSSEKKPIWDADKYLKPVIEDDPWLLFDFEGYNETGIASSSAEGCSEQSCSALEGGHHVNVENGLVTLSELHFSELQGKIQCLQSQVHEKELLLKDAEDAISRMRQTLNSLISSDKVDNDSKNVTSSRSIRSVDVDDDHHYFSSYSHFGIHHEMLSDKVRSESYRDAIKQCASGRKVLDLGCGTGILSMFAASGGAEKVVAIDQSDIIYQAIDIIRENGLEDRIKTVKGRLEDTKLPDGCDKFDVIVSEWMGYFLLFEGMLDSVIYARDNHLAPGGLLLPNRCSITLSGYCSPERHKELIEFWSNVYGYKMSCMKKEVVREANVEIVEKCDQITDFSQVFALDLMVATVDSVNFSSNFELKAIRNGDLTSVVGHFDVFFDLEKPVLLSTSPSLTPTHWKQTVFYLKKPIAVKEGEVLSGKIICQRHKKEVRSLTVTLIIKDQKQVFVLH